MQLDSRGVRDNSRGRSEAAPPDHRAKLANDPEGVAHVRGFFDPFRVTIDLDSCSGGHAPGYYISRFQREEGCLFGYDSFHLQREQMSPP